MSKFSLFISFVFLLTLVMSGCGDFDEFDESDAESDDYALETDDEDSFHSGLTTSELEWKIRLKKMKEKAEEENPFSQSGEEPSPSGGDTIMDELDGDEEDVLPNGLTTSRLEWLIHIKKMKEKAEGEEEENPFSQSSEEPSPSGGDTIMDELDGDEEDVLPNGLTTSRLEWLIHIKKMKEKAEGEEEENPFSQSGEEPSPSGGDFEDETDNGFSPGISLSKSEWENFVKQLKEEEREENGE